MITRWLDDGRTATLIFPELVEKHGELETFFVRLGIPSHQRQTGCLRLGEGTKIVLPDKATFGGWKIGDRIGGGGQGTVWKAYAVGTRRHPPRALKACFSTDTTERARFEREIDLLARFSDSPHILRMVGHDKTWAPRVEGVPSFAYYVSDRCDASLAESRDLGDAYARLQMFREACEAVRHLHELDAPLIHRDVKPANFLLAKEPRRLVLADFGIARPLEDNDGITRAQEVVGTEHFRAPETLSSQPASVRMDIFSLGRLLEWLLTGEESRDLVPRRVPRGDRLANDAADAIDAIIAKATQPVAANRYASVREMLDAIPTLWLTIRDAPKVAIEASAPRDHMRVAVDIARSNDRARWREEEIEEKRRYAATLLELRPALEATRLTNDKSSYIGFADSLIRPLLPRLQFALGGVLSQTAPFEDQRRTMEELVSVTSWNWSGRVEVTRAPLAVGFFFNYIHGALCCELGRDELAVRMALEPVDIPHERGPKPLFEHHELVGWPKAVGGNYTWASAFLHDAYARFEVLTSLFSSLAEYQLAVASYSMILTVLDFSSSITMAETLKDEDIRNVMLGVPPMYLWFDGDLIGRASRRTIGNPALVDMVTHLTGVERSRLVGTWPRWKKILDRLSPDEFYGGIPLGNLQ